MAATTIKVSKEPRDRLKALPGETLEDTIVEMLDKAEQDEFWAQADRALACRAALPPERHAEITKN